MDYEKAAEEILDPEVIHELERATPAFHRDKFYCLDGGFATTLQQSFGVAADGDPLWSCRALHTDPEAVIKAHVTFIEAGANIITTNTYQGHPELFKKHISDLASPDIDSHLLLEKAVKLADEAIMRVTRVGRSLDLLVAGSVGPYGACLGDGSEYTGDYVNGSMSRETLKEWHLPRIKRLMFGQGVNIIAAETIPSYIEALAILDAMAEIPGTRCWISFQCRDESRTAKGELIEDAFRELLNHPHALKIKAVGVNCVKPSIVTPLLKRLNTVNTWKEWPDNDFYEKIPYIVYPNLGEDWDSSKKIWKGNNEDIIRHVKEWMELGANVIGGCCKIGPDMIRRINEEITSNLYGVNKLRLKESRDNKRPIDDWAYVEKKLKRPIHEELKQRMSAAKEFFRDASEDGDASALITAQLEAMMANANRDIYDAIKNMENRSVLDPTKDDDFSFLKEDESK